MTSWEYLFINACLVPEPGGGKWHARLVNNELLPDWENGPTLDSFIRQLEAEGWQLARKHPDSRLGRASTFTLLFKRPRQEELPPVPNDEIQPPPALG